MLLHDIDGRESLINLLHKLEGFNGFLGNWIITEIQRLDMDIILSLSVYFSDSHYKE